MEIKRLVLGLFETNTYLLINGDECLLIDPASKAEKLIEIIDDKKLVGILLTHGHLDHIKAVDGLYQKYNVPIYINKEDELLARDKNQGKKFGIDKSAYISSPVIYLNEGITKINSFTFETIFTPGHTKGSVCYKFDNNLFTGDTLFNLSAGRTDLDTGSDSDLKDSLRIIKDIKENLNIYPGHESITTLDFEKENNPYLI